MGARTIDAGSMDEQGGMKSSRVRRHSLRQHRPADKAKLEKQIASLESERKSFHRGKSSAKPNWKTSCKPSPRTATW